MPRLTTANALCVTIRPPVGVRARLATSCSSSVRSRRLTAVNSTPSDGATDWSAANWPIPADIAGSRRIAVRVMVGMICLSSSSHFPVVPYSKAVKPVALPPGWQNSFAERLIGTIRRECVDHIVVLGETHLRWMLQEYARYYNTARTHRSLDHDGPVSRPVQQIGRIASHAMVGGLHHQYVRI